MDKRIKNIPVLFENDFCMVLNKPAGLSVQGGEGVRVSLDSILSEAVSPRPLLVHRLDKETSGLILVAKTKEAAGAFSALFAGSRIRRGRNNPAAGRLLVKQYLGICSGIPSPESGVINAAINDRGTTKESETFYKCLASGSVAAVSVSLVSLESGTGRMHQIRRHLAWIGCPLLGDDKYGDFPLNRKLKKELALNNLLLHASRLVIPALPDFVPAGLDISASPPDSWRAFLPLTVTPHLQ